MKILELELNKRLLIVEFDDIEHFENVISCDKQGIRFCSDDNELTKLICKGSELTEDIAKDFSDYTNLFNKKCFADYNGDRYSLPISALESFISAIESNSYHWEKNPIRSFSLYDPRSKTGFHEQEEESKVNEEFKESESRTFNPEKTLIFEIL